MGQQYEYPIPPAKKGVFSSLTIPNFRLYFIGHFISMVGVWMQIVALSWLVWRLTKSGDWLGSVGFSSRILTLLLCLVGGVVADRMLRRNLIVITQGLALLQAAMLAVLTILGMITPELIIILALLAGAVYAFDFPARLSFITDMVGKDQVDNAVALSSSIVHAARVIGPALAGIIVAYWGEGACFVINAATFLALIIALLLMNRAKLYPQPTHNLSMHKAIHEGLKNAWLNPQLKKPLILLAMVSFFGMPYYILVPIFVDKVYHAGPETYGFLMASSAVGALLGSLIMARSPGKERLRQNMPLASLGFAISVITFAWMRVFWMGMVTMVFVGLFALIGLSSINAWLQKEAPDEVRGRIMSIFTMLFFGAIPFGALLAGFAAQRIGAPTTITIGGSVCILSSLWFMKASSTLATTKN